eukprot:GHVH01014171.1.p1 GENE.GHVH01014171.1~~GHVH01014171.1.p1  ORF type:complete len:450 (+),score=79.80 GHVH01014171.1:324-1673(+)
MKSDNLESFTTPDSTTTTARTSAKKSVAPAAMTDCEKSMMQRRPKRATGDETPAVVDSEVHAHTVSPSPPSPASPESPVDELEPMHRSIGRSQLRKGRGTAGGMDELKRDMTNNLNKLTVENFPKISSVISTIVSEFATKDGVTAACTIILDKAVSEIQSMEVYVDLVHVLSTYVSSFAADGHKIPNSAESDSSIKGFTETLGVICNDMADTIAPVLDLTETELTLSAEEKGEILLKKRMHVVGVVKAITSLMMRRLLKPSFWRKLMRRLTFTPLNDELPADHLIEAACESIKVCGLYLTTVEKENLKLKENDADAPPSVEYKHFQVACKHLNQTIWGFEALILLDIPARVECIIKDILDAKSHNWFYKTHREKAKGLADIREDQKRTDIVGGSHVAAQYGTVEQMGVRANLLNDDYRTYYLSRTMQPGFTIIVTGSQIIQDDECNRMR